MADASGPVGGVPARAAVDSSDRSVGLADRPGASGPPVSGQSPPVALVVVEVMCTVNVLAATLLPRRTPAV